MNTHERAERARAVLDDVVIQDALKAIRNRQHTAFANSAPDDRDAREQAHQRLMAVNDFERELLSAIADEQMEIRKRGND